MQAFTFATFSAGASSGASALAVYNTIEKWKFLK